jgi:adenylate kinase
VCGGELKTRSDDQDEEAIDQRHGIYYDTETGTMAAVNYFKERSSQNAGIPAIVSVDGHPGVKEVSAELVQKLDAV